MQSALDHGCNGDYEKCFQVRVRLSLPPRWTPLQHCLFTPELQWQSRGQMPPKYLTGAGPGVRLSLPQGEVRVHATEQHPINNHPHMFCILIIVGCCYTGTAARTSARRAPTPPRTPPPWKVSAWRGGTIRAMCTNCVQMCTNAMCTNIVVR
jgi:hypothetical protein